MITIVMTTYAPEGEGAIRARYAERTMDHLGGSLYAPEDFRFHIADDGSADTAYIKEMLHDWGDECSSWTRTERKGIGASLNKALATIDDKWLYITDDWLLTDTLNLNVPCRLIDEQQYDLVRLGPPHPNLRCMTRFCQGLGWWLDIDPTFGGFAFATRPFLASKDFYHICGPFVEGANAYVVEQDYAVRVAELGRARIAYYDASFNQGGPWRHIGKYEVGRVQP
jgi:hypothetical protein